MGFGEIRAGQPLTLKWFPYVDTADGEQRRYSATGTEFWAAISSFGQTSREFRNGLEGVSYSVIFVSTNISKLEGIEKDGGAILYKNALREISYANYDEPNRRYFIALK